MFGALLYIAQTPGAEVGWTKSIFTFESVAPSRCGGGGLRNTRVANGNIVPWHHSAGDNLRSAYASTLSQ